MPRNIITQGETLHDIEQLVTSMEVNSTEVPHLEAPRALLVTILKEARELMVQQAALAASRQEVSKKLRDLITEGRRLTNFLRVGLKQHYGTRSEKLAEFKIQPFRGRKAAKPGEPVEPTRPAASPIHANPQIP